MADLVLLIPLRKIPIRLPKLIDEYLRAKKRLTST